MCAVHLIGASMPRSGHHYLVRLLTAAIDREFLYCEFYQPQFSYRQEGCCQKVPCRYAGELKDGLSFQKNHDFNLDVTVVEDCRYVVQVRRPVPRLFSHFKLRVEHKQCVASAISWNKFTKEAKDYYIRFWQKWVTGSHLVIPYWRLMQNPAAELERVFSVAKYDPPVGALDRVAGYRDGFKPTRIEQSDFYDAGWANEYEAEIAERCPGFDEIFPDRSPYDHRTRSFGETLSRVGRLAMFKGR